MDMSEIAKFSPAAQRQILSKLGGEAGKPESKYRAEKARVGKMKFDSRKESARYQELMLLLRSGKIRKLKVQPEFTLQEAYYDPECGDRVRALRYRADFSYEERQQDGAWSALVVEDVKSPATRTRVYLNKAKMLLEELGIKIREV